MLPGCLETWAQEEVTLSPPSLVPKTYKFTIFSQLTLHCNFILKPNNKLKEVLILPWNLERRARGRLLQAPLSLHSLNSPNNISIKETKTIHYKPSKMLRKNNNLYSPIEADWSHARKRWLAHPSSGVKRQMVE